MEVVSTLVYMYTTEMINVIMSFISISLFFYMVPDTASF